MGRGSVGLAVGLEIFRILLETVAHEGLLKFAPPVAGAARQEFEPERRHFIGGLVAGNDASRRLVGVADVHGRIIVAVAHRDDRPLREHDRLAVVVDGLPIRG